MTSPPAAKHRQEDVVTEAAKHFQEVLENALADVRGILLIEYDTQCDLLGLPRPEAKARIRSHSLDSGNRRYATSNSDHVMPIESISSFRGTRANEHIEANGRSMSQYAKKDISCTSIRSTERIKNVIDLDDDLKLSIKEHGGLPHAPSSYWATSESAGLTSNEGEKAVIDEAEEDVRASNSRPYHTMDHVSSSECSHVLQRWIHMCTLILQPSKTDSGRAKFKVHPRWIPSLRKLHSGDAVAKREFAKATVEVRARRMKDQKSGVAATSTASFFTSYMLRKIFPIHPDSTFRKSWVHLSLIFVAFDTAYLPILVFMAKGVFSKWNLLGMYIASCFWVIDLFLSFSTGTHFGGEIIMKPSRAIRIYVKTWCAFDVVMLITNLVQFITDFQEPKFGRGRRPTMDAIRYVCLLRLLRIAKLGRMMRKSRLLFFDVLLYNELVRLVFIYCTIVHFVACLWYAIGKTGKGWVRNSDHPQDFDLEDNFWHTYFSAAHWSMSYMHGTNLLEPYSTQEWAFSTLWMMLSFVCAAVFIAKTASEIANAQRERRVNASIQCARYAASHNLSPQVAYRAQQSLEAWFTNATVEQQIDQDKKLLAHFPQSLQDDILEEARKPHLTRVIFMKELEWACQRIVRSICVEALHIVGVVQGETVFSSMESCHCMRFIQSGLLIYTLDHERTTFHTSTTAPLNLGEEGACLRNLVRNVAVGSMSKIRADDYLSEGTLWTSWQYCGNLICAQDSLILDLNPSDFFAVVEKRSQSQLYAANHAQMFVSFVNDNATKLSDQLVCNPSFVKPIEMHGEDLGDSHFIFISHCKIEAGTEATLLQGAFADILEADGTIGVNSAGIFLDSEDLSDLKKLVDHVKRTQNLVLLLTPLLLTRPWCLVEIVTAIRSGVHIVPVEIVRPGTQFKYPTEDFYQQLLKGKLLSKAAQELLESHQITLEQLEQAIREIFTQIAISFSPQRSKAVRGAEVDAIVNRCKTNVGADKE